MPDEAVPPNLRLADLLRLFRRRWRVLAITTTVVVALALALSLSQAPTYQARARVLVQTPQADTGIVQQTEAGSFFPDRELQNVTQFVESLDLRAQVAAAYDGPLDVDDVSADRAADGSDSIDITVTAPDADDAAELVNLYADTYISYSETQRLDTLIAAISAITEQLDALTARRAEVVAPLDAAQARLLEDPENGALASEVSFLAARVGLELDAIDSQRNTFQQTLQNLALAQDLTSLGTPQIVSQATPSSDPVSPKPLRDGVVGLIFGLGLGVMLAIAREFLDESVRTVTDLEALTGGRVPVLGAVPQHGGGDDIVTLTDPNNISAEAYRSLRTAVRFIALDRSMRVIQVTSPVTADGKSTTSANLAAALAQAGHRVVLVSCDLRRPRVHELFGVNVSPGFTDVVIGESSLREAIQPTESGVFLLASGTQPPNPSELLGSSRSEQVFEFLAEEFEFVVVDSTPVLPVTDAIVVSRFAQGVVVVAAARDSTRHRVQQAIGLLEQAGANVIGLVLNKVPSGHREGYNYLYSESRADEPVATGRLGRKK